MNQRLNIFRFLVVLALLLSFVPTGNVLAAAPDTIGLYKVTIQPQPDGTWQMRYEFTNYCAVTDFPSADFYIGLPNTHFAITSAGGDLSGDTGWVTDSSQSGVKAYVNFRNTPKAGQCFNFWYEIHQEKMAYLDGDNVSFQYQPSWFDFATITRLEIWWKLPADQSQIVSMMPEPVSMQDGWAVWIYDNMAQNAKTDMLNLLFTKTAFPNLPADVSTQPTTSSDGVSADSNFLGLSCLTWIIILVVVLLVIIVIAAWLNDDIGGGSGSSGGGGFFSSSGGGGHSSWGSLSGGSGGSSGHSSGCAGCAGCACACAGGGR